MKYLTNAQSIELDDLPQYSHWIHYLLGLKKLSRTLNKNADSISREYGQDKWGILLEKLRLLENPSITDADKLSIEDNKIAFYANGKLFVDEASEIQSYYFHLIRTELQSLSEMSGHLVELGSGYGSIILKLASLNGFDASKYTAGEITDTGVACMNLLASHLGNRFEAGFCDLNDLNLVNFNVPENAIFMTCWAAAYVKGFSRNTLNEIIKYNPKVVIHIEPIYEHWSEDSLLHMLWKRYSQMNDYNQNLLKTLKSYETEGLIKIIEERKNIIGINPLAPVSLVKWVPL